MQNHNIKNYKTLKVFCTCGKELVKYKKGPGKRLIKIHYNRILKDYHGIFKPNLKENTIIYCPNCNRKFATVRNISGKWVFKLNMGSVGKIKS